MQHAKSAIDQQVKMARCVRQADDMGQSSGDQQCGSVASDETSAPPLCKKAKLKLFPFMMQSNSSQPTTVVSGVDNIKEQLLKFTYNTSVAGKGLHIFNDSRFCTLKPLAMKLFTAPASSASSERVFSKAGLIFRPTRSRLSKSSLSKLVFLSYNDGRL